MDWRLKGAIQKVLGHVPFGARLHYELQKRAGGLRAFDRELAAKIEDWTLMVGHLGTAGVPVGGARFLEMGTGWYPTFPLCLLLGGAAKVITLDLNRHLKPELTLRMAEALAAYLPAIARATGRGEREARDAHGSLAAALRRGASLEEATGGRVEYRAPAAAAATGLPAGSLDVVFSNSVLEHVPPPAIERCLAESRRVLCSGGVIFHAINCGDHYAYADGRINQLNYLKYSDRRWRLWNNEFLYQNRLRAIDFLDMARAAGFEIAVDASRPHPMRLRELSEMKVHPECARYTPDQLAITSCDFVARNP